MTSRLGAAAEEILLRASWPPAAVASAHVLASEGLDAYQSFPHLDVPMHLAGGFAIACFFSRALFALRRQGLVGPVHGRTDAPLLLALTCSAAVAWELLEFMTDRTLGTRSQGGLEDTLSDILLGIVGGAILLAWRRARPARSSDGLTKADRRGGGQRQIGE